MIIALCILAYLIIGVVITALFFEMEDADFKVISVCFFPMVFFIWGLVRLYDFVCWLKDPHTHFIKRMLK